VYYCQAWHLAWESTALFPDRIEAWANGPVVPALYRHHRGRFQISEWPRGKTGNLAPNEIESIDVVLNFYGNKPGYWLSELTHSERPWIQARRGLARGEPGTREITKESMAEYYLSLL
jgi:uncharacterized phage-associated protein